MEIQAILQQALAPLLLTFLFTSILSLSLGITIESLLTSLKQKRTITISLVTNILFVPVATLLLTMFMPLDTSFATGLILYSMMAGTEGGPKFVQLSGGNVSLALGLLVILLMLTICVVPFAIPLFIEGASINIAPIIIKLFIVVALPLALGLFIKSKRPNFAERLLHISHRISVIALIATIFTLVYVNFDIFTQLTLTEIFASLMFFIIAFCLGFVSGGRSNENRRALAIMTFARNGSVSMLVASSLFGAESKELVTVTIMSILSVVIAAAVCALFNFKNNTVKTLA